MASYGVKELLNGGEISYYTFIYLFCIVPFVVKGGLGLRSP